MLSQESHEILSKTAMEAVSPANWQILVNSVRPGFWNTIVPMSGAPYAVAMAHILEMADGQGWLRDLVQRLAKEFPSRPEFATILAEIDRGTANVVTSRALLPASEMKQAAVRETRPRRIWIRWSIGAAVIASLLVLGTIAWNSRRPSSVAVVAIENESGRGEGAWVGTAIAELLASDLEVGSALLVTPPAEVAQMKRDLQLGGGINLSKERLEQIGKRLSVRWVIVGSYRYKLPDDPPTIVRLRLRMFDTANGKEIASATGTGSDSQLDKLISPAVQDLRKEAKLPQLSNTEKVLARASLPLSSEALQPYSEALIKLRRHDATGARELLGRAAAIENHPLIHSALADAHLALQDRGLAGEEARKAVAAAGKLSKEKQLQLQARAHELASPPGWIKAVELRRQLWTMTPRKLEHGLHLADTQISQGDEPAALLTIAELREAASDDPRVDLVEARAHQQFAKFAEQKKSARAAAANAEAIGAISLAGEARLIEATADYRLGDRKGMEAAIKEARGKFYAARDDYGEARALEHLATTLDLDGAYDDERYYLDLAMKIHVKRRDEFAIARVWLNTGTTFYSQDRMDEALPLYEIALKTFKELDTPYQHGAVLSQIGALKFLRGDLKAAQARYEEALGEFERASDRSGRALALTNLGEVYECRGNLERALEWHNESLKINKSLQDPEGVAYDRFRLGEVLELQGDDPVAARASYNKALEEYSGLNRPSEVADIYLALAELDIDEGKSDAAQKSLSAAEAIFNDKQGHVTMRPARSLAVTAESLLTAGKQQEALALAGQALSQTDPANLRVRLPIEITLARIRAKSAKREDVEAALVSLQQTAAKAHNSLFVMCELEARLAAAEIEEDSGRPEAGPKLAALATEAKEKGFGRIATRASRI